MTGRGGATANLAALLPVLAFALSGCASLPKDSDPLAPTPQPLFDALAFFVGHSEGRGSLRKVFSDPVAVRVESHGSVSNDGVLTLIQRVEEGDKAPRTRTWEIRKAEPGRYTGTLTDAVGPIQGETQGNQLTLRYTMKDGFDVTQVLTLSADAQRAHNVLKVAKLGITVAVLAEDIARVELSAQ